MKRGDFMRYRKQLAAATLGLALAIGALSPACPAMSAYAAAWQKNANGSYTATDGSTITGVYARGIDVSHRKQSVSWSAVAADDIQFVMLGTRYNNAVDPYFDANARGAASVGLKIGAYLYSYATTAAMAEAEADFVLNLIKDYPISYPVVMDVESAEMSALSSAKLSEVINAFCKKIENAGYYPMIFTNDYWISNKIDLTKVHYDFWVARYNVKPSYQGAAMWQASNAGQVNGISGNVDINFTLKDLSSKLPANRWRQIGGKWYYYQNYTMQTGWINDGQSWYYMNTDGTQYKGWLLLNNEYYYLLPETGQMVTGWKKVDNRWYYLKSDGRMASGWAQVDGKYYYLLNGAMVTGWLHIGPNYYYMKGDGSMVTGWRKIDNSWYFFGDDGAMKTGWLLSDGKYYYLDPTYGRMYAGGSYTIGQVNYTFDQDGVCQNEASAIDGGSAGSVYTTPGGSGTTIGSNSGSAGSPAGNSTGTQSSPAGTSGSGSSGIAVGRTGGPGGSSGSGSGSSQKSPNGTSGTTSTGSGTTSSPAGSSGSSSSSGSGLTLYQKTGPK